jgi:uncharacterized protein (TIGR02246 family)
MPSLLKAAAVGRVACGLLLVLVAQACTSDAPESDAPPSDAGDAVSGEAEIRSTGARVVAAWNGDDPAAVAAYYTSDAVVTADSTYRGRDEIRDRWVAPLLPLLADLAVSDVEVTETGEGYTATGRYSYMLTLPDSSPVQVNGTYRNTWRQENGTWLIASSGLEIDGPEAAR